jgi:uncharacterized protein with von Willebrand factor type A (vWA) domain
MKVKKVIVFKNGNYQSVPKSEVKNEKARSAKKKNKAANVSDATFEPSSKNKESDSKKQAEEVSTLEELARRSGKTKNLNPTTKKGAFNLLRGALQTIRNENSSSKKELEAVRNQVDRIESLGLKNHEARKLVDLVKGGRKNLDVEVNKSIVARLDKKTKNRANVFF